MRITRIKRFLAAVGCCWALSAFICLPAAAENSAEQAALAAVRQELQISDARSAALRAEVRGLKKDQTTLSRALAQAAAAERRLGRIIGADAAKLQDLAQRKQQQEEELNQKRAEMAEILAGLEKLSFNPPPAVLVRADAAAEPLYAALLLSALLPQMEAKTKAAQADMAALKQLEQTIAAERRHLADGRAQQREEQLRLRLLLEEKARLQQKKRQNLQEEEANRKNLAEKAQSLQDLLGEVEKTGQKIGAAPDQMQIATKFSALRGRLPLPADGKIILRFGQTADGKKAQGDTLATASAAMVVSPAEGVVRYAGAFRSYGKMLILDVGENYYLILAGMAQIHVAQGQFLLQGEPVGKMETVLLAGTEGFTMGKAAPQLYIELRKAGRPVNPALWWAQAGADKSG